MKIFCICLPKRKEHCLKFFERLGIEPIYSPITTIAELKLLGFQKLYQDGIIDDTYYKFLQKLSEKDEQTELNKYYGKIACSLSHIIALKEFLKSGDGMPHGGSSSTIGLIFEDDNRIPDEGEIIKINDRMKEILTELNKESWIFCNLSPCLTNKDSIRKKTNNLYVGKLGFCMNSYLVTPMGAKILINMLPLTKDKHTLDTCLSDFGKNYPENAFEVHPRLFEQKSGHTTDSTLGNFHNKNDTVPEYRTPTLSIIGKIGVIIVLLGIIVWLSMKYKKIYPALFLVIFLCIVLVILTL